MVVGIIGTGRIASRFLPELLFIDDKIEVAVYNPRIQSAKRFAERMGMEDRLSLYDDQDEFFSHTDAVYIASPHETHFTYSLSALKKGKHVLCEKPLAFCEDMVRELYEAAEERSLVFMEAVKTAYTPGFIKLCDIIKNGCIGHVHGVEATFTRLPEGNEREVTDTVFGGSFTEYGSYGLLAVLRLLGTDYENADFDCVLSENGTDKYTRFYIKYNDALGMVKTGLGVKSEGELLIEGDRGYALVPAPWWKPVKMYIRREDPNVNEEYSFEYEEYGLRYEIEEFLNRIKGNTDKNLYEKEKNETIARAHMMKVFLTGRIQK